MWQTVYKCATIAKDLMINIENIDSKLKLSCRSGAASALSGKWWGNAAGGVNRSKGLVLHTQKLFPEVVTFIADSANAGGMNVMSYDLSDNPTFHECPPSGGCTLSDQVEFYLNTYKEAGIPAGVPATRWASPPTPPPR
jgi:hypothetical protein